MGSYQEGDLNLFMSIWADCSQNTSTVLLAYCSYYYKHNYETVMGHNLENLENAFI